MTVCGLSSGGPNANDFGVLFSGTVGPSPSEAGGAPTVSRILKSVFASSQETSEIEVSFFINGSASTHKIVALKIPPSGSASYSDGEWLVYDDAGIKQVVGLKGDKGDAGISPTVSVGPATVVTPATNPSVTDADAGPNADLRFNLPRARNISVASTTTGAPGTSAAVSPATDGNGDIALSFTIPRGDVGPTGPAVPLSVATPQPVAATSSAGTSAEASRSDHAHAHGNQAGGTLHAVATTAVAGFMSSTDKTKLDGVANNATNTPLASTAPASVGTANSVGVGTTAARADHAHAHGAQTDAAFHAVATTSANGFMSSIDKTKLDGVANSATNTPLSSATPQSIAEAGSAGSTSEASRADHVHAHGDQAGGTLHAAATTGAAGFMSPADKTKLDGLVAGATANGATTRSSATASASTALTTLISHAIAAGEVQPGSEYDFTASLRLINTTTATNSVVTLSVGATNVLVLTQANGTTAAATPGAPIQIKGTITFYSATQAECVIHYVRSNAVAANVILNTSAPITVSAAGATTIDLKFNTSGATATFICRQARIQKVK